MDMHGSSSVLGFWLGAAVRRLRTAIFGPRKPDKPKDEQEKS